MGKPKPRLYVVDWARREEGTTEIMATSAKEAERIAYEGFDLTWWFDAGDYIGMPKARPRNPKSAGYGREDES